MSSPHLPAVNTKTGSANPSVLLETKRRKSRETRVKMYAYQLEQLVKHDSGLNQLLTNTQFPEYYKGVKVRDKQSSTFHTITDRASLPVGLEGILIDRLIRGAAQSQNSPFPDTFTRAQKAGARNLPESDLVRHRRNARRLLFRHPALAGTPTDQALSRTFQLYNPALILNRLGELAGNRYGVPGKQIVVNNDASVVVANYSAKGSLGFDTVKGLNQHFTLLNRSSKPEKLDLIKGILSIGTTIAKSVPDFFTRQACVVEVPSNTTEKQAGLVSRLQWYTSGDVLQVPNLQFWKKAKKPPKGSTAKPVSPKKRTTNTAPG
jgi:hypothetical protein